MSNNEEIKVTKVSPDEGKIFVSIAKMEDGTPSSILTETYVTSIEDFNNRYYQEKKSVIKAQYSSLFEKYKQLKEHSIEEEKTDGTIAMIELAARSKYGSEEDYQAYLDDKIIYYEEKLNSIN